MHIPNTPIHTPYLTCEQHFRDALERIKEKVADYMRRPVYECELDTPREEVNQLIIITAEEIEYDRNDQSVLYLAVEDLSLAQKQPEILEVDSEDDDPPWVEYLIRMNLEERIMRQLCRYIQEHPLCCEVCGREPATWFWFPRANEPASNSARLVGTQRWAIGETCKARLNHELGLPYQVGMTFCDSASTCLLSIEPEKEVSSEDPTTIGIVPSDYQTFAQRKAGAEKLFDGWLDHVVEHGQGGMPNPQEVENAIIHITFKVVPNLFKEPLHLVLLAIEEPSLATERPTYYSDLVEANGQEITASLLLFCAVMRSVSATLHQRWHFRQGDQ